MGRGYVIDKLLLCKVLFVAAAGDAGYQEHAVILFQGCVKTFQFFDVLFTQEKVYKRAQRTLTVEDVLLEVRVLRYQIAHRFGYCATTQSDFAFTIGVGS